MHEKSRAVNEEEITVRGGGWQTRIL